MIFKSTSQTLISKEPWYLKRWFGGYLLDSCMRVGMREREERCAVIFIRSCCAIMISAHHYSHPVSDVPATSMPQKALCLLWTRRGERQRNIEFEKYRMKASVRVSQMIRNTCVCVCVAKTLLHWKDVLGGPHYFKGLFEGLDLVRLK